MPNSRPHPQRWDLLPISTKEGVDAVADEVRTSAYLQARRIVGREDAEEVASETLLRLYAYVERHGPVLYANRLVGRIAKNAALDLLRRKRPIPMDPHSLPLGRRSDPGAWLRGVEEIHRLLRPLQPDERALVLLRVCEGLSYDELAEAFEVSRPAIRQRYSRAIRKLKERWCEADDDVEPEVVPSSESPKA